MADINIMPQTLAVQLIPKSEFDRVRAAGIDFYDKLALLADMIRANTLAEVKRAGSGHLGSSLSAADIVTWLYFHVMNVAEVGIDNPDRDVYFSSKGHDVPSLYAVLHALGIIPRERLLKLRRLGGLDGHPDVGVPGIEANSGSLGMGISKARGIAWAKRYRGYGGRVFVLTGDGEWQEGQNYEALQAAAQQRVGNLTVIVDHNKVQSDKLVREIVDLGRLEAKFGAFGWHVARCDGHDFRALADAFALLEAMTDKPKLLIADTIKGRGVSFMEHPAALETSGGLYPWHAGAPDDESFLAATAEIFGRLRHRFEALALGPLALEDVTPAPTAPSGVSREYVADAYGQALVELAARRDDLIVLSADLAADCRLRAFERAYPDRFIENGIAEQDMVSMAGGLARQGLLPVVNSFASFLASRANEQIYTNAGEQTKIIYALHYAGLIPAGPGKSHQSLRDVSLLAALPNCTVIQPCNAAETRQAVEYAVNEATENVALRLVIGPSPRIIELPAGYRLSPGRGATLVEGTDAVLFAYGPVMLHEALDAAEALDGRGFSLCVVNMPWLNRVDADWLGEAVADAPMIFVLEDHAPQGALYSHLLPALVERGLMPPGGVGRFAVEGFPACGTPPEALRCHRLDGASLARRILSSSTRYPLNNVKEYINII